MPRPTPKRFNVGPLNDHDHDWFMVWTALKGATSPGAQVELLIAGEKQENKQEILDSLKYSAAIRGMDPNDLFKAILENPSYLKENPPTQVAPVEEQG